MVEELLSCSGVRRSRNEETVTGGETKQGCFVLFCVVLGCVVSTSFLPRE